MIQVRGPLTIETVPTVMARADPGARLDLRGCRFIDPVGMVALAVAAQVWGPGHPGAWRTPADPDVLSYLTRMRVARCLREVGGLVPDAEPHVTEHDQRGYLYELTRERSDKPAERIGTIVWERLGATVSPQVREVVWACLIEAWQNVLDHSTAQQGFAAAQVLARDTPEQRVVIGIADGGIGIASSLAGVLGPLPHDRAVRAAVEGTSATGDQARGCGLSTMRAITARELRGRLLVHSGHGYAVATGPRLRASPTASPLPGTIVGVEIPCGTA